MSPINIHTSNRLEVLAEVLAGVLRKPLDSVLTPEIVVVQSKGMERWVSMQLAERHGICANYRFPFPNAFVHELFRRVHTDLPEVSGFDPEHLTWRIMDVLPRLLEEPGFEGLRGYLGDGPHGLEHVQLSRALAETYDQYLLYRPDWVLSWEKGVEVPEPAEVGRAEDGRVYPGRDGETEGLEAWKSGGGEAATYPTGGSEHRESRWQAVLWRKLVDGCREKHRAAAARDFLDRVRSCNLRDCGFPERISVFGISYLPPFHLQILDAVAHFSEVHLFLLNPCREYWGDIASRGDLRRLSKAGVSRVQAAESLYLDTGNTLLASMGVMGRDFFDLLWAFDGELDEHFLDPGDPTLLISIQSDILMLTERSLERGRPVVQDGLQEDPDDLHEARGSIRGWNDRSIQVHSCHSPMREVEVLHDHLLEMFEQSPDLLPKDILVMAPDIEAYAPFIHAIFGSDELPRQRIPYSVSDRSMRRESPILDTFLAVLEVARERFSAPQVLGILESGPVQARFGLAEEDMDTVRRWVREVRIRWGWDEDDRRRQCGSGGDRNTWRWGMDRLLLGYAMPGHGMRLFNGILPYDDMEGRESLTLGRFLDFLETLQGFACTMGERFSLTGWSEKLMAFANGFFLPDADSAGDMQFLRALLDDLAALQNSSGFDGAVDLPVVRYHLKRRMEGGGFGYGFLTGGVTFCSMLPMRSIPFRVICLLGMDVSAYPRQRKPPEFDLMSRMPRKGDRSPRNDDRYLFLETLLSARDRLYISYTGQSIRDNSPMPPAVPVSELLEYIRRGYGLEHTDLVAEHRLQPFSPAYFKGSERLFSYSPANCAAAGELLRERQPPVPFIPGPLPEVPEEWRIVDVWDLKKFYANPCRFLLQRRLGVFLDEESEVLEETEPFQLEGLERYHLEQELMERRLEGIPRDVLEASRKASGGLPHGMVGECVLSESFREVERFASATVHLLDGGILAPLPIHLVCGHCVLKGILTSIVAPGLLRYRFAQMKPKDLLNVWIDHLALNAVHASDYPSHSFLVGLKDRKPFQLRMEPVPDAVQLLAELLEIYREGLTRPLPFFPASSHAHARELFRGKSPEQALNAARVEWKGNGYGAVESDDPYIRMCFGETADPLGEEFRRLSVQAFGPLLNALEER